MTDSRLSEHFWLREFTRSEYAARRGADVVASAQELVNMVRLCQLILEPLRYSLNASITITSGLRPEWLNAAIGGSAKSDHKYGRAADIIVAGYTPRQVCERIIKLRLPYQQVILEFDRWTHVSVCPDGSVPLLQALRAEKLNGVTTYRDLMGG